MDWFLYDRNLRHERFKYFPVFCNQCCRVLERIEVNGNIDMKWVKNNTKFGYPLFPYPIQPVFTCSKLTIETLEQGVKYIQN